MALNNTCMVVSVSPIADIATAACFDSVVLPVSSEGMAKAQALLDENACLGGSQDEARFTHPCERRWSTVIHLGLEDAAKGLKVEMAAANMRAQDGASASASSVDDDGSVGGWSDAFDHKPREGVTPISSDGPWLFPSTGACAHVCASRMCAEIASMVVVNITMSLARTQRSCEWLTLFFTARLDCLSLPRLREISASEHVHHVKELWSRDAGTYFCNELYFRSLESARQSPAPHPSTVFVHLPDLSVASVSDLTILVREIAKEVVETRHMGAC